MMEAAAEAIQHQGGSSMNDASLARMLATVYAQSYLFRRVPAIAGSPRPHHGYVR